MSNDTAALLRGLIDTINDSAGNKVTIEYNGKEEAANALQEERRIWIG